MADPTLDSRVPAYYRDPETGETSEAQLWPVDAARAVDQFPDQWSLTPWPAADGKTPISAIKGA